MSTKPDSLGGQDSVGANDAQVATSGADVHGVQKNVHALIATLTAPMAEGETADERRVKRVEAVKQVALLLDGNEEISTGTLDPLLRECLLNTKFLDDLHGVFPYLDAKEKTFYRALLVRGKNNDWLMKQDSMEAWEGFSRRCQNYLANIFRREGNLVKAMEEYQELLEFVSHHKLEKLPTKGQIQYEIGYIHYLQGELTKAADLFRESADNDAATPGRDIGAFISRSLQYLVERLAGTRDLKAIQAYFEAALVTFTEKADTDPNAKRWVMNARVHLMETLLEEGNLEEADAVMDELRKDPWIAANPSTASRDILLRCEAPLALLKGDSAGALKHLDVLIPNILTIDTAPIDTREASARHYLHAGIAYEMQGKKAEAKKVWEYAMRLPKDQGNGPWQKKIEEKLAM